MSLGPLGWALVSHLPWQLHLRADSDLGAGRRQTHTDTFLVDPAGHQALLPGQVSIPRGPSPGVLTACLPGFTGSFLAHGFLDSQGHSWPTASLSMVSGESTDLQTQLAANRIHHASYRGFSRSPAWAPSQPDGFWFSLLPPAGRVPPASLQPQSWLPF